MGLFGPKKTEEERIIKEAAEQERRREEELEFERGLEKFVQEAIKDTPFQVFANTYNYPMYILLRRMLRAGYIVRLMTGNYTLFERSDRTDLIGSA